MVLGVGLKISGDYSMAIWHSSITRYRVRLNNGIVVAEGLYRLWTTPLLDPSDQHLRIPRGTLVFGCDMKSTAECEDGDLWLSCLDVCRAINTRLGQVFDSCLKALLRFQVEDVVV